MILNNILLYSIKAKRKIVNLPLGLWGRFVLFMSGVKTGRNLNISSAPLIFRHKNAKIVMGHNVTIANRLMENPSGVIHPTVLSAVKENAQIVIGNNVGISGAIIYSWERIVIGDNVNIGAGVKIYDTDFHPIDKYSRRSNNLDMVKTAPVFIANDVWIGTNTIILKGVTIGEGAIIGAGSVVVNNIEPNTIAGGVPAKVLRKITE